MLKKLWDSRTSRWVAAVIWMGLIFYLSAQAKLPDLTHGQPDLQDVAGHFIIYAILALLWRRALAGEGIRHAAWLTWAVVILYSISDEYHQYFVPNRQADPFDLVIDALGAAGALLIIHFSRQPRNRVQTRFLYARLNSNLYEKNADRQ